MVRREDWSRARAAVKWHGLCPGAGSDRSRTGSRGPPTCKPRATAPCRRCLEARFPASTRGFRFCSSDDSYGTSSPTAHHLRSFSLSSLHGPRPPSLPLNSPTNHIVYSSLLSNHRILRQAFLFEKTGSSLQLSRFLLRFTFQGSLRFREKSYSVTSGPSMPSPLMRYSTLPSVSSKDGVGRESSVQGLEKQDDPNSRIGTR